jgi:hypothetical protein
MSKLSRPRGRVLRECSRTSRNDLDVDARHERFLGTPRSCSFVFVCLAGWITQDDVGVQRVHACETTFISWLCTAVALAVDWVDVGVSFHGPLSDHVRVVHL